MKMNKLTVFFIGILALVLTGKLLSVSQFEVRDEAKVVQDEDAMWLR